MAGATTRYARNPAGDSIAYQVHGDGPPDLVYVPGFISHVELFWTAPALATFYERLASFSRLILFDKRGTGLSDPLPGPQPLEERATDVQAVMDAAGSERAALVDVSEGCAFATVFAATHPERTMVGTLERGTASLRMAKQLIEMWLQIDLRDVLSSVAVPTLVLHHTDEIFPIEAARYVAARIPDAQLVELPGTDHVPWEGDTDRYVGEVEEFLTGVREHRSTNRVLATLVCTDLVNSTGRAVELGDAGWHTAMARHDEVVRQQLQRFDGREVTQTGDGFLMAFDGPARAMRCATAILRSMPDEIGLDARAGIHTGEVELVGSDVRGLAVHVAARVGAHAVVPEST